MNIDARIEELYNVSQRRSYQQECMRHDPYRLQFDAVTKIRRERGEPTDQGPLKLEHLAMNRVLQTIHTPAKLYVYLVRHGFGPNQLWLTCAYKEEMPVEEGGPGKMGPQRSLAVDLATIDGLPLPELVRKALSGQRTMHRKLWDRFDLFTYLKRLPKVRLESPVDIFLMAMFCDTRGGRPGAQAFGENQFHLLFHFPDG